MSRETDYTTIAPRYDQRYMMVDYRGIEEALLEFVDPTKEVDVLEVGCGTGHWLRFLEHGQGRRVGIDPSHEMLSLAHARAGGPLVVSARAEALPWADQSFDRLFCINAFHHFRDQNRFLRDAHRVLRPGGWLLTVGLDPHVTPLRWWVYDYFEGTMETDRARYPPSSEIRAAMSRGGFAHCATMPAQRFSQELSVREAEARGYLHRTFTSQLSLLSDRQFEEGLSRLRGAGATAESPEPRLRSDFILYATVGQRA